METESHMIKGWGEVAIYLVLLLTFILLAVTTVVTGFDSIYAQLFVIPVALASIWNSKKGAFLALLYGLLGIALTWLTGNHLSIAGVFQATVYLLVAVAIGIPSARKNRLLQLIRESEQLFRAIAGSAGDGVMAVNREGKLIFASPAAAGIAGLARVNSTARAFVPARSEDICLQAIKESRPVREDLVVAGDAGDRRTYELRAKPVTGAGGTISGAVGTFREVTECRKAQAALQESRDFYASLLENCPGLVWRSDRDGKIIYSNRGCQDLAGRHTAETDLDCDWQQEVHEADRDRRQQAYSEAREYRKDFTCTYRLRRQDGTYRWMVESGRPQYDAGGQFSGYTGYAVDITGQKLTVDDLLQENSRLAEIVEEAPDAVLTMDAAGNIGLFNKKAGQLLQFAAGEVRGRHISTILPPGSSLRIRPDQSYVRDFRRGDETLVKLNVAATSLPGEKGLIITLKDLSAVAGLKIVPLADGGRDTDQRYTFKKGVIYLIDKKEVDYYMDLFVDRIERSPGGLCISRQPENVLREKYRLDGVPVIWLSNIESSDTGVVKPGNIHSLTATIAEFIDAGGSDGTILLDGMEYLIARNGFDTMLKFIQLVNDKIMVSNCSVMFCIDPDVLEPRQLHLLLSEMTEFREN